MSHRIRLRISEWSRERGTVTIIFSYPFFSRRRKMMQLLELCHEYTSSSRQKAVPVPHYRHGAAGSSYLLPLSGLSDVNERLVACLACGLPTVARIRRDGSLLIPNSEGVCGRCGAEEFKRVSA